jgi:hypothetical protein
VFPRGRHSGTPKKERLSEIQLASGRGFVVFPILEMFKKIHDKL